MSDIPEAPDSTPTNPKGRLSNEELLAKLLEDAGEWRKRHDREANDRHGALMTGVIGYQNETRAEIKSLKGRIGWLETHGVARVAMALLVVVNILIGAIVYLQSEQLKIENARIEMLRESPVIRAEKTFAPGKP